MKYTVSAALAGVLAVQHVSAHATFQDLWVDGVDYDTQCARQPLSNSPVTDVTSDDMACNAGTSAVSSNCPVAAGSTVTVEMHQQPGDRTCSTEAIGGAHYGPVIVYMAAVADATAATGADAAWFKVFQDTWAANGTSGSADNWGTKDLNTCCGMMDVLIPADLAAGDYLLRAEAIALHAAGSEGGAQFYMTCYQLTVTGSDGTAAPGTVAIPGAYNATDAGILIDIYQSLTTYDAPGPTVYAGGSTKSAGAACANCEATCTAGAASTGVASAAATSAAASTLASSSSSTVATSVAASSSAVSSSVAATTSSSQAVVAAAASSTTSSSSVAAASTTLSTSSTTAAAATTTAAAAASTSKASCKRRRARLASN